MTDALYRKDEIVLLAANPYHLGIVSADQTNRRDSVFIRWLSGEAWMRPDEIVRESVHHQLQPVPMDLREKPPYDIFGDNSPTSQPEIISEEPAEATQPAQSNEGRRQELEHLTVKQLKEQFRYRGEHWEKFANMSRKQSLIDQLLIWQQGACS